MMKMTYKTVTCHLLLFFISSVAANFSECVSNEDCKPLNVAVCDNNMCKCPFGNVFNTEGTLCLPIATSYGAQCEDDMQCAWLLGKHRCNVNRCECDDGWRYFKGRCIKSAGLHETCSSDEQCFNGYDMLAMVCREGVCQCNAGYYLRGKYDCRPQSTTDPEDFCSLDLDCKSANATCIASKCTLNATGAHPPIEPKDIAPLNLRNNDYIANCSDENKNCSSITNSICYPLTNTCICKRGYFLRDGKCIAELGMDVDCKDDADCVITPGRCISGKCYCRKTYFSGKANNACQKPMTQDHWFCNNNERCNVFGTEVTCLANQCRCKLTAELDHDYICRKVEAQTADGCNSDEDCTRITNSVCSNKAKCECPQNYRIENNICLPNIGATCDDLSKSCTIINSQCGKNKNCICNENYVPNEDNTSCLKVSSGLHASCNTALQCLQAVLNSDCIENQCQCIEGFIEKENKCNAQKFMNDVCTSSKDCFVMMGPNVQCRNGKCQCSADMQPTEDRLDCKYADSSSLPVHGNMVVMLVFCYIFLKFSMQH